MISRLIRKTSLTRNTEGFTLVEVMIAIVLLVMISVAIYQATTQTFRYRARAIGEGDFYGGIRLAMGLIDRDVAALFSPVNFNPKNFKKDTAAAPVDQNGAFGGNQGKIPGAPPGPDAVSPEDQTKLDELLRSEYGQTNDYWLGATDLSGIRPSRFVGTDSRLQFVSASHMRVYKNTPESEFTKIIYELREDKNSEIVEGTKLLVRIENPAVFSEEKKNQDPKVYPLLPGVKSFKFRYYRKDKKAWEVAWDTNRDDMKGLYPDLIELQAEIVGANRLTFKAIYMFKPETPFYGIDPTL